MGFNPPCDGKSYKCPRCVSDSKSITPEMRVNNYLHKSFVLSAGKLFCTACREKLSIKTSPLKSAHEVGEVQPRENVFSTQRKGRA